METGRMMIKIF